jgi:hypothetical protein
MQNLCLEHECPNFEYRSCENVFTLNASILLHWTQHDVWLCFGAFRKPSACNEMQNFCFGLECTILVYRSCGNGFAPNSSILLHLNQNDFRLCFGAFRNSWTCKKIQNLCLACRSCEMISHQMHPLYMDPK